MISCRAIIRNLKITWIFLFSPETPGKFQDLHPSMGTILADIAFKLYWRTYSNYRDPLLRKVLIKDSSQGSQNTEQNESPWAPPSSVPGFLKESSLPVESLEWGKAGWLVSGPGLKIKIIGDNYSSILKANFSVYVNRLEWYALGWYVLT